MKAIHKVPSRAMVVLSLPRIPTPPLLILHLPVWNLATGKVLVLSLLLELALMGAKNNGLKLCCVIVYCFGFLSKKLVTLASVSQLRSG